MIIYGVSVLSFCYLIGQILGEYFGKIMGLQTNIGGVGFAMLFLILINSYLEKRGYFNAKSTEGINFWSQMYIPIIVAMAASQNVKAAVSAGMVAIFIGIIPVAVCFYLIPIISKYSTQSKNL